MLNRTGLHQMTRDCEYYGAGIIQGSFGRVTVAPIARALVPHVHAEYNLLFRLDGPVPLFISEKRALPLGEEVIIAFNPWQPHRKEPSPDGPSQVLALLINADWLGRVAPTSLAHTDAIFSNQLIRSTDEVARKARTLAKAVTGAAVEANGTYEVLVADLLQTVIGADSSNKHRGQPRATDARIRRAVRILRDRAHENPSMEAIAREVGMSRSRFFEQFKRTVGASPQQYLDWARMSLATEALVYRSSTLQDVAAELGFAELTNFTRFIRQHLGLSPGIFRRRTYVVEETRSAGIPDHSDDSFRASEGDALCDTIGASST
jgi:AraC-like DNA-binding protein